MSEFHTGIITIITLIGFIIKNFNKQYLLNSIGLIGGFFSGYIFLLKSISFLSFWKFFNIHFILMNLITFLLIYVLYVSNKDTKEYMDKQNKGEEIKECNENLPVYNKKMILNHVLAGFLGGLHDPFSVFFIILFFNYRCLLTSTLHSFFYKGVTSILLSLYVEKLGCLYNFNYILFIFLTLITYCVVYFVKKKPRVFLIIGLILRIIGTIIGLIFFLFIYKYHSHDFMPMCEKAHEFLRLQIN